MSREVTIKISATDNFSTVLNKYKTALDGAGEATDKAGKAAKKNKGLFSEMGTELKGMIAGVGLAGVIKLGAELNEMGIRANKAKSVFSELTTEMGGYESAIARLRQTTGGVVDDTLLMESANKLMLSGLTANQDELNKVIELSTKLGAAMGEDAATSIENFSLMLLNQSIPRLDTFGISGAKVRAEINELIRTGQAANREEAFKLAVFEQGALALDKLGASANVAESQLGKLQVRAQNFASDFGGNLAQGVEGLAGIANAGQDNTFGDVLQATLNAVSSEVTGDQLNPMAIGQERQQERENSQGAAQSLNVIDNAFEAMVDEPARQRRQQDALVEGGAAYQAMLDSYGQSWDRANKAAEKQDQNVSRMISGSGYQYQTMLDGFIESQNRAGIAAREQETAFKQSLAGGGYQYQQMLSGFVESQERAAQAVREQEVAFKQSLAGGGYQYQQMLNGIMESQERAAQATRDQQALGMARGMFGQESDDFQAAYDNLSQTTISGNGMTFTNPEEVQNLQNILGSVNAQVDELARLNELGLIPDEELEQARQMAASFGQMANDAERTARSIEDLSLSQLFGQGDGGQLAEMGARVEGLIGDTDIAGAYNDEIGLASGSETLTSQAFDAQVAPALAGIAESQGVEAARYYTEAYLNAIREGQTAGLDQQQLVNAGQSVVPGQMGDDGQFVPQAIFPQPTEEEGGIAPFGGEGFGTAEGFSLEGYDMLSDTFASAADAAAQLSETEIEVDTDAAQEAVAGLETLLQAVVNTAWSVTVDVKYNDPGAPTGAVGGGGGSSGGGAGSARRTGGSVPGVDSRTGPIPIG
jgi:hypothetical protein